MNYSLSIRKEAELDIKNAFEYYQNQRQGLDHDFILCIEDCLSKIERNPAHYKIFYKGLRHVAICRFPYRILFLVQDNQVIATAVFHAKKDPHA